MVTGLIFRPFPRETIPNWIARHIHMSGVSSSAIFIEYLTGRCDLGFSYDLPSRLELLVDKFRLEPHFTTHDLIDKHTLFPFYSRFMTQERKNVLRDRMKFKNDI